MLNLEQHYLSLEPLEDFRKLLLKETDPTKKKAWFSHPISFGTAGLRGLMQPGISGINGYTIAKATTGLAHFLENHKGAKPLTVCISFDNRYFSMAFALIAARVLAHFKIRVKLASALRPTPWLSFAVRTLKADAGIMITASHNPKEYNGFKVYLKDGAQISAPLDKQIMEKIHEVDHFILAGEQDPYIEKIDHVIDEAYLAWLKQQYPHSENRHLKIAYSPLCGTGMTLVPKALDALGFKHISFVQNQMKSDPNFAGIATPNPETEVAMHETIRLLEKEKLDVALVTDPDADRIGCAVLHQGHAIRFDGHQIALIILDYLIQTTPNLKDKVVVSSFVTTHLIEKICKAHKLVHKQVLTGFKYIGQVIDELEKAGHPERFLLGAEESYGYLVGTHVRDKDAIVISCIIAQAAEKAKKSHQTLMDRLLDVYKTYGLSVEASYTYELAPGTPTSVLTEKLNPLFTKVPDKLLDEKILKVIDYRNSIETDLSTNKTRTIDLPKTDALGWFTQNLWVIIRPSGTEPKIRFYAGLMTKPEQDLFNQKTKAHQTLEAFLEHLAKHLL